MDTESRVIESIIDRVQNDEKYVFSFSEVVLCAVITRRKLYLNQQDDGYMNILFENELRDCVMRHRINHAWRNSECID